MSAGERPAAAGELCTCGRPARIVFVTETFAEVGWCGISDGGRRGACAFCGTASGHDGERCPAYTLRPVRARRPSAPPGTREAPGVGPVAQGLEP